MSRVGKKPVDIPSGVEVKVEGSKISVKGSGGVLTHVIDPLITASVEDGKVLLKRGQEDRKARSIHGLTRSIINNMVVGVNKGFEKNLEISGVGFRAQVQGRTMQLSLGFSHPVNFPLPDGIEAKVDKQTLITLKGRDRHLVGQVAAKLKAIRRPEPYKGKGIKYAGETILRKEGKSGKK
jgi:large subunit ribosomal protein L6